MLCFFLSPVTVVLIGVVGQELFQAFSGEGISKVLPRAVVCSLACFSCVSRHHPVKLIAKLSYK